MTFSGNTNETARRLGGLNKGADPAVWISHSPASLLPQRGIIMEQPATQPWPRDVVGRSGAMAVAVLQCTRPNGQFLPLFPQFGNVRGVASDSLIVATTRP